MCLILFSYKSHSNYKLILAANRDEFYARPTLAMDWWKDKEGVLAGRDQEKDGTWMGINKNARFAALTNYRQMPITEKFNSSRGLLVSEFLSTDDSAQEYTKTLMQHSASYDGYNLIFGPIDNLHYFSNKGTQGLELEPGIYGVSNHLLNTPWPKVESGKQRMLQLISNEEVDTDSLFDMLENRDLGEDSELPDTGVGLELERLLSPAFIKSPEYGTRCSSVLLVDWENNVTFEERSYVPEGACKYQFQMA